MHNTNRFGLEKRVPRYTRWNSIIRLIMIIVILSGAVYSFYAFFLRKDVYVDIQDLINDHAFEKVKQMTEEMIQQDPLDVRTLKLMGKNYFLHALRIDEQKKSETEEGFEFYKSAVESFKKAILLDKSSIITSEDYMLIGFSYMKQGEAHYSEALEYFHLALVHNTNDRRLERSDSAFTSMGTVYRFIGYLYFKTGEFRKALNFYQQANLFGENNLNLFYIGLAKKHLKEYRDAATAMHMVYDRTEDDLLKDTALRNLAGLHYTLHNLPYSEQLYARAVNNDTNYAEGYYWLGSIAERRGDTKTAVSNWRMSVAADVEFGPAILKLRFYDK